MNIPEIPENLYEEALVKFADKEALVHQWLSAAAIILMTQYKEQPEGLLIDIMGAKLRLTLEEIPV